MAKHSGRRCGRAWRGVQLAMAVAMLAAAPGQAQEDAPQAAAPGQVQEDVRQAQEDAAQAPTATQAEASERGPVTNLPMPRYVSLKVAEGNARRGPSLSHRIDWVFVRRDMPLEITGEYGHWRRVRDRDGAGGWVHYSLLSGVRTVVVSEAMADLRLRPEPDAPVVARAEAGVVARLGPCEPDWCRIYAGGHRGWVRKSALWGVAVDEVRE